MTYIRVQRKQVRRFHPPPSLSSRVRQSLTLEISCRSLSVYPIIVDLLSFLFKPPPSARPPYIHPPSWFLKTIWLGPSAWWTSCWQCTPWRCTTCVAKPEWRCPPWWGSKILSPRANHGDDQCRVTSTHNIRQNVKNAGKVNDWLVQRCKLSNFALLFSAGRSNFEHFYIAVV